MSYTVIRRNIMKSNNYIATLTIFVRYFGHKTLSPSLLRYNKINNHKKHIIVDRRIVPVHRLFSLSSILSKKEKKKSEKPAKVDLNEAKLFINVDKYISQMDTAVEELKNNFMKHLTLRSSVGSMDQIMVTFEGDEYMLQELVQFAYKPKMVVLNAIAFPQAIPQILEAISKSGLNVNPQQDGTTLYIPIPKVTKEHRENLAKNAKAIYIVSRDKIKDIKNKECKSLKNKPSISVDQIRRISTQLDTVCQNYINKAESILDAKQKELLKSAE